MDRQEIVYPYIPNSAPAAREEMLRATGAGDVAEFYEDVPPELRLGGPLDLPEPLLSEYALKRHVEDLLARNRPAGSELLSFLGAGCY
ncbi:MAG: aminomethyl-transferring glycine dehydrogenase, partial [Chloroflexi bacterium]